MSPIRFTAIQTEEEYKKWQDFAASFGHTSNGTLPLITMSRGDRMFGYYHPIKTVVAAAWHTDPKICTPRDFRESVEAISNYHCLDSMSQQFPNGVCYVAGPPEEKREFVTDAMLVKMGFEDTGLKVYRRVP